VDFLLGCEVVEVVRTKTRLESVVVPAKEKFAREDPSCGIDCRKRGKLARVESSGRGWAREVLLEKPWKNWVARAGRETEGKLGCTTASSGRKL
jgi:hypothetical protein